MTCILACCLSIVAECLSMWGGDSRQKTGGSEPCLHMFDIMSQLLHRVGSCSHPTTFNYMAHKLGHWSPRVFLWSYATLHSLVAHFDQITSAAVNKGWRGECRTTPTPSQVVYIHIHTCASKKTYAVYMFAHTWRRHACLPTVRQTGLCCVS